MVVLLELSYLVPDKHITFSPLNWALHLHMGNAETSVSNHQQGHEQWNKSRPLMLLHFRASTEGKKKQQSKARTISLTGQEANLFSLSKRKLYKHNSKTKTIR